MNFAQFKKKLEASDMSYGETTCLDKFISREEILDAVISVLENQEKRLKKAEKFIDLEKFRDFDKLAGKVPFPISLCNLKKKKP